MLTQTALSPMPKRTMPSASDIPSTGWFGSWEIRNAQFIKLPIDIKKMPVSEKFLTKYKNIEPRNLELSGAQLGLVLRTAMILAPEGCVRITWQKIPIALTTLESARHSLVPKKSRRGTLLKLELVRVTTRIVLREKKLWKLCIVVGSEPRAERSARPLSYLRIVYKVLTRAPRQQLLPSNRSNLRRRPSPTQLIAALPLWF